ncbi:MAG: ABC transporter ATP-binding protein [Phycisphaerae bacterium]
MALIEIRSLSKLYRMGDSVVRALDGVNLTIEQGEFLAITGASGSGKSTMMHLLGCLDRPTQGDFLLDGRNVREISDRELAAIRNRKIGFVFQTFNLINRTTALDNVALPLFYARKSNVRNPARKALERVGLAHRASHRPNELSGGERQRVAIARAIVNEPLLILADEPTGNLDTRTGEQIMQIFRDLNEQGATVILVTHEADIAVQARRIVQMRDGRIIADRSTDEFLKDPPAGSLFRPAGDRGTPSPPEETAQRAVIGVPELLAARGAGNGTPAVVAPNGPNGAPADAEPEPPRTIRGATGALILGALGPLLLAAAWITRKTALSEVRTDAVPSTNELITGFAIIGGLLLATVVGIVAIVWGRGVLRRIRQEPGPWRGAQRARLAVALGCLGVATPLAFVALTRLLK